MFARLSIRRLSFVVWLAVVLFGSTAPLVAQSEVFSGPQVGEPLPVFQVRGVFDEDAGKVHDYVTEAAGKPLVLVFVHDVTRPSIALVRTLTGYTHGRRDAGLATGVVWLDDDATQAETMLKRIRHALTPGVPTGISVDGGEGPGSYGLNRQMALTVLVGKQGKVTANFALVQPSLQADLPKILQAVVEVAGGEVPDVASLVENPAMMRKRRDANAEVDLRRLLGPVIRKNASDDQVDTAARVVEALLEKDAQLRQAVGRAARTIVRSGKLANYGTPHAQRYIADWAKKFGPDGGDGVSGEDRSPAAESPVGETRDESVSGEDAGSRRDDGPMKEPR